MSTLADLPYATRFQAWYPYFESYFQNLSTTVCNASLSAYLDHHLEFETTFCYRQVDCILANMRESTKAHLSSASVILGLTPTILSMLGLRIAEISLLATYRPLLSFLLILGAPAVYPTRMFEYDNPISYLQYRTEGPVVNLVDSSWAPVISALEYLFALGAIANSVQNSLDLGYRTVFTWKCGAYFMPILWNLFPAVIHLVSAIPFNLSDTAKDLRRYQTRSASAIPGDLRQAAANEKRRISFWRRELQPSTNRSMPRLSDLPSLDKSSRVFNLIAVCLGFIHIVLGVLIFSSLLFISVRDSVPVIIRYAISVCVCRAIVVFELSSIRRPATEHISVRPEEHVVRSVGVEANLIRRHLPIEGLPRHTTI